MDPISERVLCDLSIRNRGHLIKLAIAMLQAIAKKECQCRGHFPAMHPADVVAAREQLEEQDGQFADAVLAAALSTTTSSNHH